MALSRFGRYWESKNNAYGDYKNRLAEEDAAREAEQKKLQEEASPAIGNDFGDFNDIVNAGLAAGGTPVANASDISGIAPANTGSALLNSFIDRGGAAVDRMMADFAGASDPDNDFTRYYRKMSDIRSGYHPETMDPDIMNRIKNGTMIDYLTSENGAVAPVADFAASLYAFAPAQLAMAGLLETAPVAAAIGGAAKLIGKGVTPLAKGLLGEGAGSKFLANRAAQSLYGNKAAGEIAQKALSNPASRGAVANMVGDYAAQKAAQSAWWAAINASSSPIEAATEVGGSRGENEKNIDDDITEEGYRAYKEDADKKALVQGLQNTLFLTGSNAAQGALFGAMGKAGKKLPKYTKPSTIAQRAANIGLNAAEFAALQGTELGSQVLEEMEQKAFSNRAEGKPYGYIPGYDMTQDQYDEGESALVGMGILGAAGGAGRFVGSRMFRNGEESAPNTDAELNAGKTEEPRNYNISGEASNPDVASGTQAKLNQLADWYKQTYGREFTMTSGTRNGDGSSWHDSGNAFDIVDDLMESDASVRQAVMTKADELGLAGLDEYEDPSSNATGGHLHFSDHGSESGSNDGYIGKTSADYINYISSMDDLSGVSDMLTQGENGEISFLDSEENRIRLDEMAKKEDKEIFKDNEQVISLANEAVTNLRKTQDMDAVNNAMEAIASGDKAGIAALAKEALKARRLAKGRANIAQNGIKFTAQSVDKARQKQGRIQAKVGRQAPMSYHQFGGLNSVPGQIGRQTSIGMNGATNTGNYNGDDAYNLTGGQFGGLNYLNTQVNGQGIQGNVNNPAGGSQRQAIQPQQAQPDRAAVIRAGIAHANALMQQGDNTGAMQLIQALQQRDINAINSMLPQPIKAKPRTNYGSTVNTALPRMGNNPTGVINANQAKSKLPVDINAQNRRQAAQSKAGGVIYATDNENRQVPRNTEAEENYIHRGLNELRNYAGYLCDVADQNGIKYNKIQANNIINGRTTKRNKIIGFIKFLETELNKNNVSYQTIAEQEVKANEDTQPQNKQQEKQNNNTENKDRADAAPGESQSAAEKNQDAGDEAIQKEVNQQEEPKEEPEGEQNDEPDLAQIQNEYYNKADRLVELYRKGQLTKDEVLENLEALHEDLDKNFPETADEDESNEYYTEASNAIKDQIEEIEQEEEQAEQSETTKETALLEQKTGKPSVAEFMDSNRSSKELMDFLNNQEDIEPDLNNIERSKKSFAEECDKIVDQADSYKDGLAELEGKKLVWLSESVCGQLADPHYFKIDAALFQLERNNLDEILNQARKKLRDKFNISNGETIAMDKIRPEIKKIIDTIAQAENPPYFDFKKTGDGTWTLTAFLDGNAIINEINTSEFVYFDAAHLNMLINERVDFENSRKTGSSEDVAGALPLDDEYNKEDEVEQLVETAAQNSPGITQTEEVKQLVKKGIEETLDYGQKEKGPEVNSEPDNDAGRTGDDGRVQDKAETRGEIYGLGITRALVNNGVVSLVGQKVKNEAQLAEIAQVLRNPAYEKMSYIFVSKSGNVVHHEVVTCKMPGVSALASKEMNGGSTEWFGKQSIDNFINYLNGVIKKYKADKLYLLHNHPSGVPTPSVQDFNATVNIEMHIPQYAGHIILDHNKYAFIKKGETIAALNDGRGMIREKSLKKTEIRPLKDDGKVTYDKAEKEHPLLRTEISSYSDVERIYTSHIDYLARMGIQVPETTAFFLTHKNEIRCVQKIHDNFSKLSLEKQMRYLKYCTKNSASSRVVLATTNKKVFDQFYDIVNVQRDSAILDVLYMDENGNMDNVNEVGSADSSLWFGTDLNKMHIGQALLSQKDTDRINTEKKAEAAAKRAATLKAKREAAEKAKAEAEEANKAAYLSQTEKNSEDVKDEDILKDVEKDIDKAKELADKYIDSPNNDASDPYQGSEDYSVYLSRLARKVKLAIQALHDKYVAWGEDNFDKVTPEIEKKIALVGKATEEAVERVNKELSKRLQQDKNARTSTKNNSGNDVRTQADRAIYKIEQDVKRILDSGERVSKTDLRLLEKIYNDFASDWGNGFPEIAKEVKQAYDQAYESLTSSPQKKKVVKKQEDRGGAKEDGNKEERMNATYNIYFAAQEYRNITEKIDEEEKTGKHRTITKDAYGNITEHNAEIDRLQAERLKVQKDAMKRYIDAMGNDARAEMTFLQEFTKCLFAPKDALDEMVSKLKDLQKSNTEEKEDALKKKNEAAKDKEKIEDFGQKIGGARKDIAGAYIAQLEANDDVDSLRHLSYAKAWKEPRYQAMIDEGTPKSIVSALRGLREAYKVSSRDASKSWAEEALKARKAAREMLKVWDESKDEAAALDVFNKAARFLEDGRKIFDLTSRELYHARHKAMAQAYQKIYERIGHENTIAKTGVTFGLYRNSQTFKEAAMYLARIDRVQVFNEDLDTFVDKFVKAWESSSDKDKAASKKEKSDGPKWMNGVKINDADGQFVIHISNEAAVKYGYEVKTLDSNRFRTEDEALEAIKKAIVKGSFVTRKEKTDEGNSFYRLYMKHRTKAETIYLSLRDFDSEEEANKFLSDNFETIMDTSLTFTESMLNPDKTPEWEEMRSKNAKDHRKGKNVNAEDYTKMFGFRGVQFGNWNNQEERQALLNASYDALMDLADILGVDPHILSLNGELGMAFGSRGRGGKNAARAHFDTAYTVINLTKKTGAGSLAHEWLHALDNYLLIKGGVLSNARTEDGMLKKPQDNLGHYMASAFSESGLKSLSLPEHISEAFAELIKAATEKTRAKYIDIEAKQKVLAGREKRVDMLFNSLREYISSSRKYGKKKEAATDAQLAKFDTYAKQSFNQPIEWRANPLSKSLKHLYSNDALDKLAELCKEITGRALKAEIDEIASALYWAGKARDEIKDIEVKGGKDEYTGETEYKLNAKKLDGSRAKPYWANNEEMLARSFAAYLEDKMTQLGYESGFLNHEANNEALWEKDPILKMFDIKPYPEGEERQNINKAYDKFFKAIRNEIDRVKNETGEIKFSIRAAADRMDDTQEITKEVVQDAFFGMPVNEIRDGVFEVSLPNGQKMYIDVVNEIVMTKEQERQAREEHGVEDVANVVADGFQFGNLIVLAKQGKKGTIHHELFHFAKHFLTKAERAILDAINKNEEKQADAYLDFAGGKTFMGKLNNIFPTLRKIIDGTLALFGNRSAAQRQVFGRIRGGEVFGRESNPDDEYGIHYSIVTDQEKIAELNKASRDGKTFKAYRAMALIDGKLYPPMATMADKNKLSPASEIGIWEQSDADYSKSFYQPVGKSNALPYGETKPVKRDGKWQAEVNGEWVTLKTDKDTGEPSLFFNLRKDDGGIVPARFNPYLHSSAYMLNDQFSSAFKRPNLVVVEMELPISELTSGYRAELAKDPVGRAQWKAGPVVGNLTNAVKQSREDGLRNGMTQAEVEKKYPDRARDVFLSRWGRPIRVVPTAEVARAIKQQLGDYGVGIPANTVNQELADALRAIGVEIIAPEKKAEKSYNAWLAENEKINAAEPVVAHWPKDFPNAVTHTTLAGLRKPMPSEKLRRTLSEADKGKNLLEIAKKGNPEAATEFVKAIVKPERIRAIADKYPDAIVVPVRAQDLEGRNMIPAAYALMFEKYGLEVANDIVQTVRAHRRRKSELDRLRARPVFDGAVRAGRDYIVVDDHITMGGTTNELRKFIESKGGKVKIIAALSANPGSTKIAISDKTLKALENKFGDDLDDAIRQSGIAGDARSITEKEGISLLRSNLSLDAIRNLRPEGRVQEEGAAYEGNAKAGEDVNKSADNNTDIGYNRQKEIEQLVDKAANVSNEVATNQEVKELVRRGITETLDFGNRERVPENANLASGRGAGLRTRGREDARGKILGLGITRDLVNGVVSLVGRKVKDIYQLAEIAQVLRNPAFEKAHYIFVSRNGNILHHETITCGLPGMTPIFGEAAIRDGKYDERAAVSHLTDIVKMYKADKVYILHNHPSTDPTPSPADIKWTAMMSKDIPEFAGHIVIDHSKYAVINKDKSWKMQYIKRPSHNTYDNAELEHPLLRRKMKNGNIYLKKAIEEYIAKMGIQVPETTAFFLTQKSEVRCVQKLHDNFSKLPLDGQIRYLRYCARNSAGARIILATTNRDLFEQLKQVIKDNKYDGLDNIAYMDNGKVEVATNLQPDSKIHNWLGVKKQSIGKTILGQSNHPNQGGFSFAGNQDVVRESLAEYGARKIKNLFEGKDKDNALNRKVLREQLEDLTGLKIRWGKLDGPEAAVFKEMEKVIRAKTAYDFMNVMPLAAKEICKVLKIKSTDEMNNYIADWVMTGAVNNTSPEAVEFAEAMKKNPDFAEKMMDLQDNFERYNNMSAMEKARNIISFQNTEESKLSKFSKFINSVYDQWVEELGPVKRMTELLERKRGKKFSALTNPYTAFRLYRGNAGRAMALIEGRGDKIINALQNTFPNINFIGFKTLHQILDSVGAVGDKKASEDFITYCMACHVKDMHIQNRQLPPENQFETPLTEKECDEIMNDKENINRFSQAQKNLVRYSNVLLQMVHHSGLTTDKRYHEAKYKWKNYIPMFRVFDENENMVFGNSIDQHITGSQRDVINPLESIIRNTFDIVAKSEKNMAKLKLVNIARCGGVGDILEEVDRPGKVGETIGFREAGEQKYLQTDRTIVAAINNMGKDTTNQFIKILRTPAAIARSAFTVNNLAFALRNVFRDVADAALYARYGFSPVKDLAAGFMHAWHQDEIFYEWLSSGAAQSGRLTLDRNYTQATLDGMTKTWKQRVGLQGFLDLIQYASEISEAGTRIGVYTGAKRAMLENGASKAQAIAEAALQSRDLMDFARGGKASRAANQMIIFTNASIQGWDKFFREFDVTDKKKFATSMARLFFTAMIPALFLSLWHKDEDWYKELPEWQKQNHWIFKLGDTIIRVPKGADIGVRFASNLVENMIAHQTYRKDIKGKNIFKPLLDNMPDWQLTALSPIIEAMTNYSFFTERPIVPRREENLPAKMQYSNTTSALAKYIGDKMDISPRKIDHVLYGYTGNIGEGFVKGPEKIYNTVAGKAKMFDFIIEQAPVASGVLAIPYRSAQTVEDYYTEFDKQEKAYNEFKATKRRPKEFNPVLYERMKNIKKPLAELAKQERAIIDSRTLSAESKKKQQMSIQKKRISLMKRALGR